MKATHSGTASKRHLRDDVRLIWAITGKDILEGIKNKNTITILVTSLLMVVFYRYMFLLESGELPRLMVYDAGHSALVAYLENSNALELATYTSEDKMLSRLDHGDIPELGLIIPADFDTQMERGSEITLQGYHVSWASEKDIAELEKLYEAEIARLIGRPVDIQTQGNVVYLKYDSRGIGVQAGMAAAFAITMVGLTLIAHLMLEEKQAKTIDMLLVSPAGPGHIVVAKALTGLFYCMIAAGVTLGVNYLLVVHWWLAWLAMFSAALFAVSLGLLLGTVIDNRGQLTLVAWFFILPMFIPMIISLLDDLMPTWVVNVSRVIPTTILMEVTLASFAREVPWASMLLKLAWVLALAGVVLAIVAWLVRRSDRESSGVRINWRSLLAGFGFARKAEKSGDRAIEQGSDPGRPQSEALVAKWSASQFPQARGGHRVKTPAIIWAIAQKDIQEAIKNKIILAIMLGSSIMVASNALLPFLLRLNDTPAAIVYDEGRSMIVRAMVGGEDFRIGIVDTREEMEEIVSESPATYLGLVLPADFDQKAGSGETIQLDGYFVHWADAERVSQRVAFFEDQLSLASWGNVEIEVDGNKLYPAEDLGGQPSMVALTTALILITLGAALVPYLVVEEKEARTMEALLVSPARTSQIMLGKAIAGGVYCLIAALVVLFLNRYLIVHWEVALLGVVLGSIFAVALGLMIGILSDNPTTIGVWGAATIGVLVILTVIYKAAQAGLPPLLDNIAMLLPTTALMNLFSSGMAGHPSVGVIGVNSLILALASLIAFGGLSLALRRLER